MPSPGPGCCRLHINSRAASPGQTAHRECARHRGAARAARSAPPSLVRCSTSASPVIGPQAGELVDRLLDPALRHTLGTAEPARLSDAIASSLHLVYIIAALAAVVTLGLACALPAALSPAPAARSCPSTRLRRSGCRRKPARRQSSPSRSCRSAQAALPNPPRVHPRPDQRKPASPSNTQMETDQPATGR